MSTTHAVLQFLATVPDVPQQSPPEEVTRGLTRIVGWAIWAAFLACVGGIVIVAIKMAISHQRGEGGSEHMQRLGWVLFACILGASGSGILRAVLAA